MARTLNLSLTDELRSFIEENCGEGTMYSTPSEFVLDLLRQRKIAIEAEKVREAAEAAREAREHARQQLETARQDQETLRRTAEDARRAAEDARHATIGAVAATAEALNRNLAQMQFLESARETLRTLQPKRDED